MSDEFRVGPWTVHPSVNTLSRNGTTRRLEPKMMQVLACLAGKAGETVSKEELLKTVWPETFVTDDVLKRCISELRRALEDDFREPRFIETIPKRGYRLVAQLEPAESLEAFSAPHTPAGRHQLAGRIAIGILATLLLSAIVVAMIAKLRGRFSQESGVPQIHSIAVLPLTNLSDDPSEKYFTSGITDELITDLSQISALRVISRTSSQLYENTTKTLPQIARELNVDAVVEGSVQRSGKTVRVTVQLIYAPQDKNLWAQSFERDLQDVLSLERTLAGSIADQIRVHVLPQEEARLHSAQRVSVPALEYYFQGNYHLGRVGFGSADEEAHTAADYFQHAIAEDPAFAPAYVGLAYAYGPVLRRAILMNPSANDYEIKKAAAIKALELDPNSSDAHDLMASIDCEDWRWSEAEQELRRAISLNPNRADAHDELATFLFATGRAEEGQPEVDLAQMLDPNADHLSGFLTDSGKYEEAIEMSLHKLEDHPDDGATHFLLFQTYALTGKYTEAIEQLSEASRLYGFKDFPGPLKDKFRRSGFKAAVRLIAEKIERLQTQGNAYIPGILSELYTLAGDKNRAFFWLEDASRHRHTEGADGGLLWLKGDPLYGPLRSEPRYHALLRKIGLPE